MEVDAKNPHNTNAIATARNIGVLSSQDAEISSHHDRCDHGLQAIEAGLSDSKLFEILLSLPV